MRRLVTSYQLRLRTDGDGNPVIRAERIARGVGFILGALLWGGLWVAMALECPGVTYDFWDEPVHTDMTETFEEINASIDRAREAGIDVEPLKGPPLRVDRPGGFQWRTLAGVLFTHGSTLLLLAIGIRFLFAGTTVVFDREQAKVRWREARLLRTTTTEHDIGEVVMALHPSEVHEGIGWRGFAVTLIVPPSLLLDVARGKKEDVLAEYAAQITDATGLELGRTDVQLT